MYFHYFINNCSTFNGFQRTYLIKITGWLCILPDQRRLFFKICLTLVSSCIHHLQRMSQGSIDHMVVCMKNYWTLQKTFYEAYLYVLWTCNFRCYKPDLFNFSFQYIFYLLAMHLFLSIIIFYYSFPFYSFILFCYYSLTCIE